MISDRKNKVFLRKRITTTTAKVITANVPLLANWPENKENYIKVRISSTSISAQVSVAAVSLFNIILDYLFYLLLLLLQSSSDHAGEMQKSFSFTRLGST